MENVIREEFLIIDFDFAQWGFKDGFCKQRNWEYLALTMIRIIF